MKSKIKKDLIIISTFLMGSYPYNIKGSDFDKSNTNEILIKKAENNEKIDFIKDKEESTSDLVTEVSSKPYEESYTANVGLTKENLNSSDEPYMYTTRESITIDTVKVKSKEYDGTNVATVSEISFKGSSTVTPILYLDYTITALFDNAEIGENKNVTITVNLTEYGASRFYLTNNTANTTASISKGNITVNYIQAASSKEYDGTTSTELNEVIFYNGDGVQINLEKDVDYTVTATYEDEHVGIGKKVTARFAPTDNDLMTNYYYMPIIRRNDYADITKGQLTFEAKVSSKMYDGNDIATVESIVFTNSEGKTVSLKENVDYTVTATFEDAEAGLNKKVTVKVTIIDKNDGYYKVDYDLVEDTITTKASILNEEMASKTLITFDAEVSEKEYDGTDTAVVEKVIFKNAETEEEITEISEDDYEVTATFDNADAGNEKDVTITLKLNDTENLSDYLLLEDEIIVKANITPKPLTFDAKAKDRIYTSKEDTTVEIENITFEEKESSIIVGLTEGESADYTYTANFENGDIGKEKDVYVDINLLNPNYTLDENEKTIKASITKIPIKFEDLFVSNKEYDGTNTATVESVKIKTYDGIEVEGLEYEVLTAEFEDQFAGDGKIVNVEFKLLETEAAEIYEIQENGDKLSTEANIIPKPISFTANILDKSYDETARATIESITFFDANGEEVTEITKYLDYIASAVFIDENIGVEKEVYVTINLTNTPLARSYTLNENPITVTASILGEVEEIEKIEPSVGGGNGVVIFPIYEESDSIFSDLDNHWGADYIYDLYEKEIVSGYPDGTFEPDIKTNRGDVAVLVCNLLEYLGLDIRNLDVEEVNFTDLNKNKYYYSSVQQANYLDIMVGYGDETFKPGEDITREEFVMVLYKLASKGYITLGEGESREFTDYDDVSSWCKEAFDYVNKTGILTGYPDGSFNPKGDITRAELVILLYQILN